MVYLLQCLKFKTDQAQDAKKMEKLNNIFFTLMARGPESITITLTLSLNLFLFNLNTFAFAFYMISFL
ncbi:putative signal recognition particle, SRP9/SRP14 subunit, signal recognition particle SRP9 [Helianthus annuus]|nr:putative signal recognition particle, SRP9/SRP14 subunit, signal recognition particle SRP9 [Helianthus annuus]